MEQNVKEANKRKIELLIRNLKKRNMIGYYCETAEDARRQIRAMIRDEDVVSWADPRRWIRLVSKRTFPM